MAVFLVACGQDKTPDASPKAIFSAKVNTLDGTYFSSTIDRSLTFKSNGMVYETSGKNIFKEMPYTIDDDGKIKLAGADILQLRLLNNESISSSSYGVLVKK